MGGVTNGNLNQSVIVSGDQTPAFLGKLGYDRQFNEDFRARLTGSIYASPNGQTNFLYSGDRAGSRYYMVMEPKIYMPRGSSSFSDANPTANFTSGRFNPSFVK
ncbi:MAG: hypothetical protein U5L96_14670 [Owenweeksia sp.]|nr:hypothetical protein [Owenweeksia sp.]